LGSSTPEELTGDLQNMWATEAVVIVTHCSSPSLLVPSNPVQGTSEEDEWLTIWLVEGRVERRELVPLCTVRVAFSLVWSGWHEDCKNVVVLLEESLQVQHNKRLINVSMIQCNSKAEPEPSNNGKDCFIRVFINWCVFY